MACYPFCKWDDLETFPFGGSGQPTYVTCRVCSETYSAYATTIDPGSASEAIERQYRFIFSAISKIKDLEDEMAEHLNHYTVDYSRPDLHLTQPELNDLRNMISDWHKCRIEISSQEEVEKEEAEKLSQVRKGKRMDQAFWTMPNPDRTDGKW